MEGCFTFQWGRFVFQMAARGGGFIYKWGGGAPLGGDISFRGGGGSKKTVR